LNPEVLGRLQRLADKLDQVAAGADARRVSKRVDRQLPGGLVPRAIMRVLAESVEPLNVTVIHEAVELVLGRSVSRSTIKNALAREAKHGRQVVRLARGRYRLLKG
jgi:siroheme synthase